MIARCLSPLALVAALSCPSDAAPDALTVLVRVVDGHATIDAQDGIVVAREATAHIQIDVGGIASTEVVIGVDGVPANFRRLGPRTFVIGLMPGATTPSHGTLHITGADGTRVVRDVIVPGQPATILPRRPWELGVFGGYRETSFGRPTSLGDPASGSALQGGATTGLSAGWFTPRYGALLELGLDVLTNASGTETSGVLTYRALGVYHHDDGPAQLRLVGGFGAQTVIAPSDGTQRDTKLAITWGVGGGYRRGLLVFRLDLRHELLPGDTGLSHGATALFGVSMLLGR